MKGVGRLCLANAKPLAREDLRAHAPAIAPLPKETRRPFWSVMIPTYN